MRQLNGLYTQRYKWSSYRATAGESKATGWLTTDWILGHFGHRAGVAQDRYRVFVAEGRGAPLPWERLTGQIYLGTEEFVARHQPDQMIRDVPRRQTQAQQPTLRVLFQRKGQPTQLIHTAYRQYGIDRQRLQTILASMRRRSAGG